MKRIHPAIAAAMATVLFFSACTKNLPFHLQPDGTVPFNITSLRFPTFSTFHDTVTFTYDQWDNPVSVIRPHPATGAPNFLFRYDARHRLTDWIGAYQNFSSVGVTGAEFWHRYFYDSKGNIVTDSNYTLAFIVNGTITSYDQANVEHLTYDAKGRVIRETGTYSLGYGYDSAGNNAVGDVYDNKVNFHRTNKIWMFLDRDYSVNNPFVANAYTFDWLPTNIGNVNTENSDSKFLYQLSLNGGFFTYAPRR
jgi:hypothetical protein